jgi:hypothetical protein
MALFNILDSLRQHLAWEGAMKSSRTSWLWLAFAAAGLLLGGVRAMAEIHPSSDVLLPYFEVDLTNTAQTGRTTLFALCNDGDDPAMVRVSVVTNWGISVLELELTLPPRGVVTANLRDWLLTGKLPGGQTLSADKIAFLRAALSGKATSDRGLYYGSEVTPNLAVGGVTFRVQGSPRPEVLWGDSFVVDPQLGYAEGETLVNLDPLMDPPPECKRHGIRFLSGGIFDAGTELMVWTDQTGSPSASPDPGTARKVGLTAELYDEAGHLFDRRHLDIRPLERIKVSELELQQPFGWVELITDVDSFVTGYFSASSVYGAAFHAYCLPEEAAPTGPAIRVQKLTNGTVADLPPGPSIPVGGRVDWTYVVTNTGNVRLTDITLTDSAGALVSCPGTSLDPGDSMTCEAHGIAVACQYTNTATASGLPPQGDRVTGTSTSHYFGQEQGAIHLESYLNGDDADTAPGPALRAGDPLHWTYTVTNTGTVRLSGVLVADQHGNVVSCPKGDLEAGEAMTCTAEGTAVVGSYAFVATVRGAPHCGPAASFSDPTHYHVPAVSTLAIRKRTNGEDANSAPGPKLLVGSTVQWTYEVTNIGNVRLVNVRVTDDRGVAVSCPRTVLDPGQSMTCTANGKAVAGQYQNVGIATGTPPSGPDVTASDPSHYFGWWPSIRLEKLVDGHEADAAPGPYLVVGSPVLWTYVVVNSGDVELQQIKVVDNQGVTVTCPKTVLQPAESMTCTASGTAVAGQYSNVGTVTGAPAGGSPVVTASDPAFYFGYRPAVAILKKVNGQDANTPPGVRIVTGSPLTWTYRVTNTGDTQLSTVGVSDDRGVAVSCPKTVLQPGESMTCTAAGTAVSGQYCNVGTATGTPTGGTAVTASDPACYFGFWPEIRIKKLTNGEDADTAPGPTLKVGDTVLWTYVVTNTGDVPLSAVQVTDDKGVAVTCPKTVLQAGESMTCTAAGKAISGQYSNVGTAVGTPADAAAVTASDPSHYFGKVLCDQGCSSGYWKTHTGAWAPTGYTPGQKVNTVFSEAGRYPSLGGSTMLQALSFSGGSGLQGAAESLLKQAVTAVLNASHSGIAYPRTPPEVIADVNAALASNSRDTMLGLATALDHDNNQGCPLH